MRGIFLAVVTRGQELTSEEGAKNPPILHRWVHAGQLVLTVTRNHPILRKRPLEARRLSDYPAALPKAFQGIENCQTHPVFDKFRIVPQVQHAYDHYDVAVELVANSLCWSFVPDWIVRANNDRLAEIRPKGWDAPVQVTAIWPKNRFLTKVLRKLYATLEKRFKSDGKIPPILGRSGHRVSQPRLKGPHAFDNRRQREARGT